MNAKQILVKAKGFIDSPEKWCKGHYTADASGNYVEYFKSTRVVSRCIRCALLMAIGVNKVDGKTNINENEELMPVEKLLLSFQKTGFKFLAALNDHNDTNHADIMDLFDKAIEAAE